jgi:hypothetical protein
MTNATTARPHLADCDCGCTFWYGPHDDLADKAGADAEAAYDVADTLGREQGDSHDALAAWATYERLDADATRLLALDGIVLRCPRCLGEVTV